MRRMGEMDRDMEMMEGEGEEDRNREKDRRRRWEREVWERREESREGCRKGRRDR